MVEMRELCQNADCHRVAATVSQLIPAAIGSLERRSAMSFCHFYSRY